MDVDQKLKSNTGTTNGRNLLYVSAPPSCFRIPPLSASTFLKTLLKKMFQSMSKPYKQYGEFEFQFKMSQFLIYLVDYDWFPY